MKHLVLIQQWETYTTHKHVYIKNDTIVGMFNINVFKDNPVATFTEFYINSKFRGRGLSHELMKEIVNCKLLLSCQVNKNNWADKLYEKYGFDFWYDDADSNYKWMKNFKNNI
jgi:predicted GNAT family N-acyltransferase